MMMGMMTRAVREGSRSGARGAEGEGRGREEGGVGGGRGRRGRGRTRPRVRGGSRGRGVRARAAERVVRLGVHGGRRRGRGDALFTSVRRNEQRRGRRDPNPGRRAQSRAARATARPRASSRGPERARGGPTAGEECEAGGESPTRHPMRIFSAPERDFAATMECPTDRGTIRPRNRLGLLRCSIWHVRAQFAPLGTTPRALPTLAAGVSYPRARAEFEASHAASSARGREPRRRRAARRFPSVADPSVAHESTRQRRRRARASLQGWRGRKVRVEVEPPPRPSSRPRPSLPSPPVSANPPTPR